LDPLDPELEVLEGGFLDEVGVELPLPFASTSVMASEIVNANASELQNK
jgi:hypothetical protein